MSETWSPQQEAIVDRLIVLLNSNDDVGTVDLPNGGTVLGTCTAIELAHTIAADERLRGLLAADLERETSR
jgi:hypothetical protein